MAAVRFTWQPGIGAAVAVTIDDVGQVQHQGRVLGSVFRAPRGGWAWSRSGVVETRTGNSTRDCAVSALLLQLRREGKV